MPTSGARNGIAFRAAPFTTSENYLRSLPALLATETVSHPQHANAHDDVAAAVGGVIATALRAARLAALEPKIVMPFVASSGPRYFPGSPPQETYYEPLARATDGRHRALAACCTASASCASEEDGATGLDKRPF
jgi:hypothetical protein